MIQWTEITVQNKYHTVQDAVTTSTNYICLSKKKK